MLIDTHVRKIDYLRLAVTDRCNLRCNYCMPEEGINFKPNTELLSINELYTLTESLVTLGIRKVRITGGEPFARKDLMVLLRKIATLEALEEISITTNATLIGPHILELKELGILNINVSLDAIDPQKFFEVTRRNKFDVVYSNLIKLIDEGFNVKVNCIVLEKQNIDQLIPMLEQLTKDKNITVRFLEEMPFNGGSKNFATINWNSKAIYNHIANYYGTLEKLPAPLTSTATNYKIPGFKGSFGIIPSFTRSFCGTCNRLRINANGDVITCLYSEAYSNIRNILQEDNYSTAVLKEAITTAINHKAKNGFEAEKMNTQQFKNSMTSIGG